MGEQEDPDNTFKIMLATDIHLGVNEREAKLANDSHTTFEEILEISVKKDVDFILLAGDMFHDNKPSTDCFNKALVALRQHCMGDKEIQVEFLSNEEEVFKHCDIKTVNYQDPNLNIAVPVFSIHGNHDDPTGPAGASAMDIMSASGLINYFGKQTDLTKLVVYPLLLKKGFSRIAIYGISHVKDERLFNLFKTNLIEFVRPKKPEAYFNILVLHQNREDRPSTSYIPEKFIPGFIQLVIWGHEHQCRINPERGSDEVQIIQPGSSVATSLCEGEAVLKHVGILHIFKNQFKVDPIRLKTVRPFVFHHQKISDWKLPKTDFNSEKLMALIDKYVKVKMLPEAKEQETDDPRQPKLPLLRLKLDYENDSQCFNHIRFGQNFSELVANSSNMFLLKKVSGPRAKKDRKTLNGEDEEEEIEFADIKIEEMVGQYFEQSKDKLQVLCVHGMAEAVTRFIEKDDKEALNDSIQFQMRNTVEDLNKVSATIDNLDDSLKKLISIRLSEDSVAGVRKMLEGNRKNISFATSSMKNMTVADMDVDDTDFGPAPSAPKRGRARGRGTSTRGTRGKKANTTNDRTMMDYMSTTTSTQSTSRRHRISDSDEEDEFQKRFSAKPQTPKKKVKLTYEEDDD